MVVILFLNDLKIGKKRMNKKLQIRVLNRPKTQDELGLENIFYNERFVDYD